MIVRILAIETPAYRHICLSRYHNRLPRSLHSSNHMFQQSLRQAVINIFGFHDLHDNLDEEHLQLFLTLPILDPCGTPCCMHPNSEYYGSDYGWPRCRQPLKSTQELCHIFQHFYLTAGDRLMREEHDHIMVKELVSFLLHACCEKHENKFVNVEEVAWRLLGDVKVWRRRYLSKGADSSPVEDAVSPEEGDSQPSRLSKFWPRSTFGSIRRSAMGRDRSASPSNLTIDSNATLKLLAKQDGRRLSSVPDRGHQDRTISCVRRMSVVGNSEEEHLEDRSRGRKRDVFGLSSAVATKLTVWK